ncbi:hypothetical protein E3N88_13320 [Mikania micrantha]|uniref:Uncharacterized protein n=1 Tax=Mikania micrantha TaxID=192012 RepID=A0A5N6P818_9ASTR|nr:hypothetical protein E3N88_13320 [Mikania micrantha]
MKEIKIIKKVGIMTTMMRDMDIKAINNMIILIKDIKANQEFIEGLMSINILMEDMTIIKMLSEDSEPKEESDQGAPIIPIHIGKVKTNKALLDYGASVSILPGSIYDQYDFGPLHPVDITVVLADSTCKRPRGMLVGVAVKIGEFCYPEDFLVLDYEQITKKEQPTVILGRLFLATANAQINCRDNTVSMTFGNRITNKSHSHYNVIGRGTIEKGFMFDRSQVKDAKKIVIEDEKAQESMVRMENSKEHIKVEARSSKSPNGLKKPPKHIKHAYENGEFVKMRVKDELVDMRKIAETSWSWVDNNQVGKVMVMKVKEQVKGPNKNKLTLVVILRAKVETALLG